MKTMFRLPVVLLMATVVFGQGVHSRSDAMFPRFTVAEGQLDENGFPTSGAKLCLEGKKNVCYQMPSHTAEGSSQLTYCFGLEPHAKILPLTNGGSWALFTATFSAGGSGSLTRLAILQYQSSDRNGGTFVNLLPYIGLTNVSEHAVWKTASASSYPVLVTADFIWDKGETHFAPHHYAVEVWRFDPEADRYKKAVSYRTSKKYEGGDSGPISVLGPERAEFLRRLSTQ